jgi:hypothetical protein
MFDRSGKWIYLETFDDFDNGLSDLIELWSAETATQALKDSAFAHFKEDLERPAPMDRQQGETRNMQPLLKSWLNLKKS